MAMAMGMKAPKKKGGRVKHIHISRAENGWTAHHEMEPMPVKRPGAPVPMYSPQQEGPNVFSGKKATKQMMDHVQQLATMGDQDADDTAEPAGQVA